MATAGISGSTANPVRARRGRGANKQPKTDTEDGPSLDGEEALADDEALLEDGEASLEDEDTEIEFDSEDDDMDDDVPDIEELSAKSSKTSNNDGLALRREIERRLEARRLERDLDELDLDFDD